MIALIITIIVLLILAGVSISVVVGDNRILSQAGNAKTETDIAEERENEGEIYKKYEYSEETTSEYIAIGTDGKPVDMELWTPTKLTSVTIPNNIDTIEDWAFRGCKGLESVTTIVDTNSYLLSATMHYNYEE